MWGECPFDACLSKLRGTGKAALLCHRAVQSQEEAPLESGKAQGLLWLPALSSCERWAPAEQGTDPAGTARVGTPSPAPPAALPRRCHPLHTFWHTWASPGRAPRHLGAGQRPPAAQGAGQPCSRGTGGAQRVPCEPLAQLRGPCRAAAPGTAHRSLQGCSPWHSSQVPAGLQPLAQLTGPCRAAAPGTAHRSRQGCSPWHGSQVPAGLQPLAQLTGPCRAAAPGTAHRSLQGCSPWHSSQVPAGLQPLAQLTGPCRAPAPGTAHRSLQGSSPAAWCGSQPEWELLLSGSQGLCSSFSCSV
ncbi:uncharacterized protein [Taeniopygia guttata]|uniref:uncharacterized protein n=1 Tax=Taeniopygia guttata TaxID=59729 RepID=UPI003BB98845